MPTDNQSDLVNRKRLLRVLNGDTVDRPPFWFMRQAGRYLPEYRAVRQNVGGFLDLCYSPSQACEVTLQPLRRFGMDAAILFSDILVIPHAMGQSVDFVAGEGPRLAPIQSASELRNLSVDTVETQLAPVFETIDRVAARLDRETALIGFAGAPWTVATYMVEGGSSKDFATIKAWSYRDPQGFQTLIDLITEATIRYLCRQIDAGAEVLQLFDTWAGALSPEGVEDWVIQPTKTIVERVRAYRTGIPIIGFPRQIGAALPGYVKKTAVTGVSLDTGIDLDFARHVQTSCVVQGNLDPIWLTVGGSAMLETARRRLERLQTGGYIFNLGHGITPAASIDAVSTLSTMIREWRTE